MQKAKKKKMQKAKKKRGGIPRED